MTTSNGRSTSGNQLVPTVITNSRGVVTTVHKKPVEAAKSVSIAPPAIPVTRNIEKMTGDEIANVICKNIKSSKANTDNNPIPLTQKHRKTLRSMADNPAYLRKLYDLFEYMLDEDKPERAQVVTDILGDFPLDDKWTMSLICASKEYLGKNPNKLHDASNMGHFLVSKGFAKLDEKGGLPSLPAHVQAKTKYFTIYGKKNGYYTGNETSDYRKAPSYIRAVETHHDELEKLFAYWELRDISVDQNGNSVFDEEDYQEYLKQGAVANGWL